MNDHVLWGYLQSEEEVTSGANSVVSYTYYWTNLHLLCLTNLDIWRYSVSSRIFLTVLTGDQVYRSAQQTESLSMLGEHTRSKTLSRNVQQHSVSLQAYPGASTTLADTFAGHTVTEYNVYDESILRFLCNITPRNLAHTSCSTLLIEGAMWKCDADWTSHSRQTAV